MCGRDLSSHRHVAKKKGPIHGDAQDFVQQEDWQEIEQEIEQKGVIESQEVVEKTLE
ncbi:MAG TPA: hypothetical protein VG937_17020 [Polyangiaceae bacterium]|nr:hypothetical protein [Polyangiaceae bacterium]